MVERTGDPSGVGLLLIKNTESYFRMNPCHEALTQMRSRCELITSIGETMLNP